MAGSLKIKNGTKLRMALDVPVGQEPQFTFICTFNKSLDESAFLISAPMKGGKPLEVDETQKYLIRSGDGADAMVIAGYVDDIVKEGIRKYWKIRRVTEQRQFVQRQDERVKVALRVEYMQDTWMPNDDGVIEKEDAMSLDISAGGLALYLNRRFEVGEIIIVDLPNIGVSKEGKGMKEIPAVICWNREAPKGSVYRNICGIQFHFSEDEKQVVREYTDFIKKKYRL